MDPVVFVCGGCRARIRTNHPDRARTRSCPRCRTPLAAGSPEGEALSATAGSAFRTETRPLQSIRHTIGPSLMLAVLTPALLYWGIPAPVPSSSRAASPGVIPDAGPVAASALEELPPPPPPPPLPPPPLEELEPVATASPVPVFEPPNALVPDSSPEQHGTGASRQVVVTDQGGRRLVCRVFAERDGETVVLLPDGSLGVPNGLVFTDEPFRPATIDEVRLALKEGPYREFEVLQQRHYLVFYRGSEGFAEATARLLESLYQGLTGALRDKGIEVREAEFPLVAVIFATEEEFRAHRAVDPDVKAYYEVDSNRIFFYETSGRDSPEIAARRRPQTVAHEGTHQVLQNIGVHPRLAPWPSWLVEGLAEYCAPTTTGRNGSWARFGAVNPFHMATLLDLQDSLALQQRIKGLAIPRVDREPGTPLVEAIVTRQELAPTDYAVSWALTHYLASRRFEEFLAYLKRMARIPPLEVRTPEEHLAEFRAAFGADLARMDRKIGLHLAGLKGYEAIPYYAVLFEQPMAPGLVRRETLVSRSPSVIRQWLDAITSPRDGPAWWRVTSWPSRTRALLEVEGWGHHL